MRRRFNSIAALRVMASVLILTAATTVGCVHRQGTNQSVTPFEQAMVWNDALAQTNNSIARGIIAVSPSLVPAQKAAVVLRAQRNIADIHGKLTMLLKAGPDAAKANAGLIQSYTNQIQATVTDLVNSGAIGVKNPETQQSFDADIKSLGALTVSIVSSLKQSGVLQ